VKAFGESVSKARFISSFQLYCTLFTYLLFDLHYLLVPQPFSDAETLFFWFSGFFQLLKGQIARFQYVVTASIL